MVARSLAAFVLVSSGCSIAPDAGESGSTEQGSSTSTSDGATSSTPPPGTDDGGTTQANPNDSSDTGPDTGVDSSGTETGDEPPTGSPGCKAAVSLAEGEHQFMLDDNDRRYIVRLPENYSNDQPWPLIFALHGNGGNPDYWDGIGGDRDIRTEFGQEAVIIIPEAIGNAWRDYDAPSDTWPAGIELELNYFDTIYQTAQDELCIDVDNVFSMGFSGGGSFSGVLGCRREYIRAIAVGGSVIYFQPEECVSAPAAWITIGEDEFTEGRAAFRDFFAMLGGCEESSTPYEPEGCVAYDDCDPATPAVYCSHPAGHVWPSIGTEATHAFFEGFYGAG
ncbi:MAG: hypothetical protein K0V04_18930 [Deltaproteobacteria bacterium]|nr:hypothetical protein [Deltaproteobacteria bacterium]